MMMAGGRAGSADTARNPKAFPNSPSAYLTDCKLAVCGLTNCGLTFLLILLRLALLLLLLLHPSSS